MQDTQSSFRALRPSFDRLDDATLRNPGATPSGAHTSMRSDSALFAPGVLHLGH
jgi:hypothetical protein